MTVLRSSVSFVTEIGRHSKSEEVIEAYRLIVLSLWHFVNIYGICWTKGQHSGRSYS